MPRFLHITDLHITAPGHALAHTDTSATFARLVDAVGRLRPAPDFIVASGDLTDLGDVAAYRHLAVMAEGLGVPVVWALGNHDDRAAFRAGFGAQAAGDAPHDHDAVIAGLHVIALDSSVPGLVSGGFEPAQIDWLVARMQAHPGLPRLLAIHHPPRVDPDMALRWPSLDAASTRALAEAIAGQEVRAILSGHVHVNRMLMWAGVPVIVTMGQQSAIDPTQGPGWHVVEGAGFAICDLYGADLQVTYAPLGDARLLHRITEDEARAYP